MADQAARLGGGDADPLRRDRAHRADRDARHHLAAARARTAVRADAAARRQRRRGGAAAAARAARTPRHAPVGTPVATGAGAGASPTAEARPSRPPARAGAAEARPSPRRKRRRRAEPKPPKLAAAPAPVAPPAAPRTGGCRPDSSTRRRCAGCGPTCSRSSSRRSRRTRALLDNAQITGCDGSTGHPRRARRAGEDDRRGQQHRRAARGADPGGRRHLADRGRGRRRRARHAAERAQPPAPDAAPAGARAGTRARPARRPRRVRRGAVPAPSDPEAEAMKLLQDRLGARPVDVTAGQADAG